MPYIDKKYVYNNTTDFVVIEQNADFLNIEISGNDGVTALPARIDLQDFHDGLLKKYIVEVA